MLLILRTLAIILASVSIALACSPAIGAVDDTSDRVRPALLIFYGGVFVLVAHIALFIYLTIKQKRKSHWIFWSTIVLSLVIIPIVILLVAMSAGMSCGFGASNPPIFLVIFELICLMAQLIPWRFYSKPTPSPVPQD